MTRVLAALVVVCAAFSREAAAQSSPWMESSQVWLAPGGEAEGHSFKPGAASATGSYWSTGMIVGAAVGVVAGALIANGNCSDSDVAGSGGCTDNAILGGLVGGIVVAIPGALIGSLFKKK